MCFYSILGYEHDYDIDPFSDYYDEQYFGSTADVDATLADAVTAWIASRNEEEKAELGHQLDDLILRCTYSKYSCQTNTLVYLVV